MTDKSAILGLLDVDQALEYFDTLFGPHDIPDGAVSAFAVRGVGEKDTPAYGVLRSSEWLRLPLDGGAIAEMLARWAVHNGGAFAVPAFVRGDVQAPSNIHEQDVVAFTALLVDLDRGDPREALKYAAAALGAPSLVVESGGRLEGGRAKLHAYWCFDEPVDSVRAVAEARELLAAKLGGDPSFGRIPQIVRIPGSVHLKGGVPNAVRIVHRDPKARYDATDLIEKILDLRPAPGQEESFRRWEAKKKGGAPLVDMIAPGGGLTFGPHSAAASSGARQALVTDVHEGGDEDRSRWTEFSKVAGHYIHCARAGEITPEEAFAYTGGWVNAHMVPPWPPERVAQEFRAILNKDIRDRGPIAPPSESRNLIITAPGGEANPAPENPLLAWSPHRWTQTHQIPARKWLVRGLVPAGKPCALVAEGGAGKTYMSLDLAVKIAGGSPDDPQAWMGEPIPAEAYGTAVVITAEDDREELAIRLSEIDAGGLRFRAGDKLIILPLLDVGGTFPLVASRRVRKGDMTVDEHGPTDKWEQLLAAMKALPDLKLVVIDTLNATMHGEENSAAVVQEYFRQATRVCGELGAALMVTHHLRKQNPKDPIVTLDDAANAFRGSEAIKASVRQMITMWHAHDYRKRMEGMGLEAKPKTLYRAGVTKANNREALSGVKTLLRNATGTLDDVTAQVNAALSKQSEEEKAWLLKAVELAAAAGHPYTTAKSGENNPGNRKGELPPILRTDEWSLRAFSAALNELIAAGLVVRTKKEKGKRNLGVPDGALDVPNGPVARKIEGAFDATMAYQAPDWSRWRYDPMSLRVVPA